MEPTKYTVDKFAKIGARCVVTRLTAAMEANLTRLNTVRLNVFRDKQGPYFDILVKRDVELIVVDFRPKNRALLLLAGRQGNGKLDDKEKYLCGHDERDWFVSAISPAVASSVSDVPTAFESLKPQAIRDARNYQKVSNAQWNGRNNDVFTRQGEWFFAPAPEMQGWDGPGVLRNEPLGGGRKPHIAGALYRIPGETLYFNGDFQQGISETQYRAVVQRGYSRPFQTRALVSTVYVKGRVAHPDHKTVYFDDWRRVFRNVESNKLGNAFID